jgi:hypothetical protein
VFPGVNGFSEYSGCSYKGGAVMGQWADICLKQVKEKLMDRVGK